MKKNNPWEALVLGGFFLVCGIIFLANPDGMLIVDPNSNTGARVGQSAGAGQLLEPGEAQMLGYVFIGIALACTLAYGTMYYAINKNDEESDS